MAYNFQQALKDGVSPDTIYDYLSSKGREIEAVQFFNEKQIPFKRQGFGEPVSKPLGVEHLPVAGMVGGGLAGGAVAGPAGAVAGAGFGAGLGKAAALKIGGQPITSEKIIPAAIEGAVSELGGRAALKFGPPAVKAGLEFAGKKIEPLVKIAKTGLQAIYKALPGISEEAATIIKKYPAEVEALATRKSLPIDPIITKLEAAREKVSKQLGTYQKDLDRSFKATPFGAKITPKGGVLISPNIRNASDEIAKNLNKNFGISRDNAGNLIFEREAAPSAIVSKGEQNAIQKAFDLARSLRANETPAHVNAVLERINKLKHYDPLEPSSVAINGISDEINAAFKAIYPKVYEVRQKYAAVKAVQDEIDKLLVPEVGTGGKASIGAIPKTKAIGKEEVALIKQEALEDIKKYTGLDLKKEVDILKTAAEINPNLVKPSAGFISAAKQVIPAVSGQLKISAAKGELPFQGLFDPLKIQGKNLLPILNAIKEKTIPIATKISILEGLRSLYGSTE